MNIVIASHGTLAEGLKNTLELILGKQDNIQCLCAYINDNSIEEEYNKLNLKENEKYLFLTDIEGGSVNQYILSKKNENIKIISGINLPFLVEICLNNNIEDSLEIAREGIKIIEEYDEYKEDFDF